jgi:hypothetical protein
MINGKWFKHIETGAIRQADHKSGRDLYFIGDDSPYNGDLWEIHDNAGIEVEKTQTLLEYIVAAKKDKHIVGPTRLSTVENIIGYISDVIRISVNRGCDDAYICWPTSSLPNLSDRLHICEHFKKMGFETSSNESRFSVSWDSIK